MGPSGNRSVTLIELLIALVLMTLVVLGFSSINLFSNYHVLSADRRSKLQNEASFILQHMAKQISKGVGDYSRTTVNTDDISGDTAIKIWIDADESGKRDTDDFQVAYRFTGYKIWYCPKCGNSPCASCDPNWNDANSAISSASIRVFTTEVSENRVTVQVTSCWEPATATPPNGTQDNPCVEMQNQIYMPGVSVK